MCSFCGCNFNPSFSSSSSDCLFYVLYYRYGRGFGIIGEIFGENSVLNQPNSFGGIFFYAIIGILGKSFYYYGLCGWGVN